MKKLIDVFKYNDIGDLEEKIDKYRDRVAAVIMEPVPMEDPRPGYLEAVRRITKKHGIVLIFDEIVSGFRMAIGGAQEYYNVVPDLACFGKAMANGFPISCVVGKKDIMARTEDVFLSTTFGGETSSMAAALATIEFIQKNKVLEHTWKIGKSLHDGLERLIKKHGIKAHLIGQDFKFKIIFDNPDGSESKHKKLFFLQQTVYRGIFFGTVITFSFSHKEIHIRQTLKAVEEVFQLMRESDDDEKKIKKLIKGKIPVNKFFRDQR